MTRRNLFKGSQDKIPKLIEESGMRHYIAVSPRGTEPATIFVVLIYWLVESYIYRHATNAVVDGGRAIDKYPARGR